MRVARNFRNDVYAMPQDEEPDKNREMRHATCRQFVFRQFGRLDKGHLSVITSI